MTPPRLPQALDFAQEVRVLADLLQNLAEADWSVPTRFKQWTPTDIVRHLHFWNEAADWSAQRPEAFAARWETVKAAIASGQGMRVAEQAAVPMQGVALFARWRDDALAMAERWADMDPQQRLPWAGPPMSARSSITARQMETWAHGQALFDAQQRTRVESDRLRNIVVLGVNTFGWSHQVRGWAVPAQMPHLVLQSPSGETWTFGEPNEAGRITGSAVAFCQVVTQTRHVADTDLSVQGEVAERWMANAQCFAGPPETPPAPGARRPG